MPRLVIVSNRVPASNSEANTGGLATALEPALEEYGGIWFGWSGRTAEKPAADTSAGTFGRFMLATIDLSAAELDGYYNRLSNQALWPAFHSRPDLVTIDHDAYATYCRVNRRFAEALYPFLRTDDVVWVHDYHLIPLGYELRKLGVTSPIGFFLHIPFPTSEAFATLPWAAEFGRAFSAYDLVGFQTAGCVQNFRGYAERHLQATAVSATMLRSDKGAISIEAHPIGIDTKRFAKLAASPQVGARVDRLRSCLAGRTGIASAERLDYSKGLEERFRALNALFEQFPEYIDKQTLFQIAAPSRLAVPEYQALQAKLEMLSGQINARFATLEWSPIHLVNRAVDHVQIAALFRACRVGLVTSLRDGMNLVAKEYVAAQSPADPGILVLSRFAGAAAQLKDAIIVNPFDIDALTTALRTALAMTLDERLSRWRSLMQTLEENDVHRWREEYLNSLLSVRTVAAVHVAA